MTRKKYQGEVNDKERSKRKLITAVGTIIKTKGYTGLSATNIAKAAGLSRRLISIYFESVDNLVEAYIRNKDYWITASGDATEMIKKSTGEDTQDILTTFLQNQLEYFYDNTEMQNIILWEISAKTPLMYKISEDREDLGSEFFKLSDKELQDRDIDLRAVTGLLIAGIYYMVLHAKSTDTTFCEIDINEPAGMERIKKAISFIVENAYKK
jgi:AcrR family transcriptional regulator